VEAFVGRLALIDAGQLPDPAALRALWAREVRR
jgi:hypothetical protein